MQPTTFSQKAFNATTSLTKIPSVLHIFTWHHLPLLNWDHLRHCSRLGHQTYNLATRTPSPPPPSPSLRTSSLPSAPPSFNRPSCRAYGPSQGACFSKGNAFSVYQRMTSVSSLCEGKLLTRYGHSKSKNPTSDCEHPELLAQNNSAAVN